MMLSADIVDDESSSELSSKAEFTSPLYIHTTLTTDTKAVAVCLAQLLQYSQNILILLAFKCFLNYVLVETECSEVMLTW